MKNSYKSLLYVLFISLAVLSLSVTVASAEVNTVLYDGNALSLAAPPDVVAYANTVHTAPPSEFQITTSGTIWRYFQWIALMNEGNWVEAKTNVETTTLGIQFWGDTNDGWARVLVDGSEVWTGNTYGSDANYPGGAYIKYLEISGLDRTTHTIRVENMGINGPGGGNDVTIYFFGLMAPSAVSPTPTPSPTPISEKGLVAYYPFDGDVKDYSGNNNHGTPKGNMAFTAGVVGNAAAIFDGKSHIEVKDSDSLDLTEDFTFAGWLNKKDAGVGGWAVVFSKGDTSSQFAEKSPYALFHNSNGIYSSVRVAGQTITSTAETNFNEWYFVTVTKDGSELKFYINGELKDTKTSAVSIPESDTNLLIGIDPPGATEYFRGSMDDLRIYNYALSQSEINAIRQGATVPGPTPTPTPVSERGLVAYYPFDSDARDHSGNNNHGTNNGANFVSGIRDQALSFDGTNDYVRIPVNINPDNMPQMTVALWTKADRTRGTIISQDDGGYDRTIDIDNRGGGRGWSAFSGSGSVLGFHPVTAGEWTFMAAVYDQDAETVKLYVNDKVYEEKGKLGNGWDYTHIASNPSFGAHYPGIIDEVRIYNSALSQSEINSLRESVTVPTITTPIPTITPTPATDEFNGLSFESRSKASGSSVQIPLTLNGIRENIGNMDMTLRYDSSVLVATEVIKGSLTSDSLFDYNIIDGTIKISLADKHGFSGDGPIAYVRFDVIGSEGSSSPLDLASLSANRADLTILDIPTQDGIFRIISQDESRGDAAGDGGELTALDALYALQMAVGKLHEDLAMDMNGDGSVTSLDAREILRISTLSGN